jgi:hypothetical protein
MTAGNFLPNGIHSGMLNWYRRMFCREATVPFGGNAAEGTNGELRSTPGLMAVVVRSVPEEL